MFPLPVYLTCFCPVLLIVGRQARLPCSPVRSRPWFARFPSQSRTVSKRSTIEFLWVLARALGGMICVVCVEADEKETSCFSRRALLECDFCGKCWEDEWETGNLHGLPLWKVSRLQNTSQQCIICQGGITRSQWFTLQLLGSRKHPRCLFGES